MRLLRFARNDEFQDLIMRLLRFARNDENSRIPYRDSRVKLGDDREFRIPRVKI